MSAKMTIVDSAGVIMTFHSQAHESDAEFRGRATCEAGLTGGEEFFEFFEEWRHGRPIAGPVLETTTGMRRRRVRYGQDIRLPGLFRLLGGQTVEGIC